MKEFLWYLEEKNIINPKTLANNDEVKRLVNGLIKIDLSKIVSAGRENIHSNQKLNNDTNNTRNYAISEHVTSQKLLNSHAKPSSRQKKYTRLSKKGSTISDKENNPISQNANAQNSVNYNRVMSSNSSKRNENYEQKSDNDPTKPSHRRNYSTGNVFKLNIEDCVIDQKSTQNKDKQFTHR